MLLFNFMEGKKELASNNERINKMLFYCLYKF